MGYIAETFEGEQAKAKLAEKGWMAPFSAETTEKIMPTVVKLTLSMSSFTDPGRDWEQWDAYDVKGAVIASRKYET